ncbi:MAG: tetratricopeptide repeat protein, partial [Acidobacteriota bacterium]
ILWRETIDIKYEKLLTVQDRVADEIVKGLALNLTAAEVDRVKREVPTNLLAYEYCLRGRELLLAYNFRLSVDMLEKSVTLDPNYAPAWAYLGRAYNAIATQQFGGREYYQKAQAACEKALALNGDQLEARIFFAQLFTETNRVEEAVPMLREVIKLSPNHARAHWDLSYAYRYAGMLTESIQEGELALQLDVGIAGRAFNTYLYDGQYEKFTKSLPLREDPLFIFYRGFGYYHMKDMPRAMAHFERAYQLDATVSILPKFGKAFLLVLTNQPQEALTLLQDTEKRMMERGVYDGETVYKLAQAYAVVGDKTAALRTLTHSIELGFFCYPYFISDVLLEKVHDEPEYARLMERARQRHEAFRRKFFNSREAK